MVFRKSAAELKKMRRAGRLAAKVHQHIVPFVRPGITTDELDRRMEAFIRENGAVPAPLGYRGYPRATCISVNEVVVHGIPSRRSLKTGDIVGIDITVILEGYHGDMCVTYPVGDIPDEAQRLVTVTERAMYLGIQAAQVNARLGDIGHTIQRYVESHGFSVVRDFVGHGIGRHFHEDPQVCHFGEAGKGMRLRPGMTFTIEPMINAGDWQVAILDDGWTAVTTDGSLSAQFEHTIAITSDGPEILTVLEEHS